MQHPHNKAKRCCRELCTLVLKQEEEPRCPHFTQFSTSQPAAPLYFWPTDTDAAHLHSTHHHDTSRVLVGLCKGLSWFARALIRLQDPKEPRGALLEALTATRFESVVRSSLDLPTHPPQRPNFELTFASSSFRLYVTYVHPQQDHANFSCFSTFLCPACLLRSLFDQEYPPSPPTPSPFLYHPTVPPSPLLLPRHFLRRFLRELVLTQAATTLVAQMVHAPLPLDALPTLPTLPLSLSLHHSPKPPPTRCIYR